jgi:hypothetical protein
MSSNANLAIRIAAILDNKGFKQADKSVKGLQSSVKKLAGAAGIGLSTAAVINFGKNAVKAFAENEKSAKRLAGVVKNMGMAFQNPAIEGSLDRISAKFGYQGEVLREAYQKLLTATGSVTKSNDLLALSLDVSAGSGEDLLTVNQDLAAVYVGNTKGLRKYNLGLSQAQLKTLKYEDAIALLTKTFAGAGGAELTTYAGKIRVLGEAAGNAQEIIGGGLVDALTLLGGEGNTVQPLADGMAEFATNTSNAIVGLAVLVEKLKGIPGLDSKVAGDLKFAAARLLVGPLIILKPYLDKLAQMGADAQAAMRPVTQGYLGSMPVGIYPTAAELQKQKQFEADRLKLEKQRLALEKKAQNDLRKRAALEKAARMLELERINLTAGLKGKISEADRISLQLQLALLDKNDTLATKLAADLEAAVKRQNELAAALRNTPKAPNPYEDWKVPTDLLAYTAASLGVSPETVINAPQSIPTQTNDATQELLEALQAAADAQLKADAAKAAAEGGDVYVKITMPDGTDVSNQAKTELTNQSLSGSFINVNRLGRFANVPQAI